VVASMETSSVVASVETSSVVASVETSSVVASVESLLEQEIQRSKGQNHYVVELIVSEYITRPIVRPFWN
jgi:hypothetical protein